MLQSYSMYEVCSANTDGTHSEDSEGSAYSISSLALFSKALVFII